MTDLKTATALLIIRKLSAELKPLEKTDMRYKTILSERERIRKNAISNVSDFSPLFESLINA